jgi:5-methyltetrahydrofolate--homocysteine methyltransferase
VKQPVLEFIAGGTRIFDGGMGSMLIEAGLSLGQCPETFDADKIRQVHEKYVEAGADFILTCTFGGSKITLAKHGLGDQTREINRRNAELAQQAAGDRAYVVGDIGPCGELLKPYGVVGEEDLVEAFTEQAQGLEDGGVDAFIIETMSDPNELRAAARAVRAVSEKPLFASMTFSKTPRGYRTVMGTTVEQAVEAMESERADVVGTNCTLAPDDMPDLVRELCQASGKPVLAEPNAGRPKTEEGRVVYPPIGNLELHLEAILNAGVRLIGGCCGTNPDYVRLLRRLVDQRTPAP